MPDKQEKCIVLLWLVSLEANITCNMTRKLFLSLIGGCVDICLKSILVLYITYNYQVILTHIMLFTTFKKLAIKLAFIFYAFHFKSLKNKALALILVD